MHAHLLYAVPLATLLLGAPALLMAASDAPEAACAGAPAQDVAPPAGNALAFALDADGVQIYRCAATPGAAPAWTLDGPAATLLDARGRRAGTHGAGPTWTAADGSSVAATKVAATTRDEGAIPWLLLRAGEHRGSGRMADVTFVQRIDTSGGLAPAPDGCSHTSVGAVARVPYRARYCFYRDDRR